MGTVPPPLYLTLHRNGSEIVTTQISSLAVGIDVAGTLVKTQGGVCTIRDRGRLVFAINDRGQRYTASEGTPSDLWSWFRDQKK